MEDEKRNNSNEFYRHSETIKDLLLYFNCNGITRLKNVSVFGDESNQRMWEKKTAQHIEKNWNNHLLNGVSFVEKVELSYITIQEVSVLIINEKKGMFSYLKVDENATIDKNQTQNFINPETSLITIKFTCHELSFDLVDFSYKKFGVDVSDMNILQFPFSDIASRQMYVC